MRSLPEISTATSGQCLSRGDIPGLANAEDDRFGEALAAGDFNCDRYVDLVVGIPGKQIGAALDAGGVAELHSSPNGIIANLINLWSQDSSGIADQAETGDAFGESLAAAPIPWRYLYLPVACK